MIHTKYNKYSLELAEQKKISIQKNNYDELSPLFHYIVDISKDTPIYLINGTKEIKDLALSIKTSALNIHESIRSFIYDDDNIPTYLRDFKMISNIPEALDIELLPNVTECDDYEITINSIATGQKNKGLTCNKNTCVMIPGTYGFSVETTVQQNDFEIVVTQRSTNHSILEKIAKLINNSCINLNATVNTTQYDVWLEIEALPNRDDTPATFTIMDTSMPNGASGLISKYKIDRITKEPMQTSFDVNGTNIFSYGTAFVLDGCLEINLLKNTDETIYLTKDINYDIALELIHTFIENMNALFLYANSKGGHKLMHKLHSLLSEFEEELSYLGIFYNPEHSLSLENDQFQSSLKNQETLSLLDKNSDVINALLQCTCDITINPMEFIQKKVVAYTNTNEAHYPSSYITSSYTGFIFSSYC